MTYVSQVRLLLTERIKQLSPAKTFDTMYHKTRKVQSNHLQVIESPQVYHTRCSYKSNSMVMTNSEYSKKN